MYYIDRKTIKINKIFVVSINYICQIIQVMRELIVKQTQMLTDLWQQGKEETNKERLVGIVL